MQVCVACRAQAPRPFLSCGLSVPGSGFHVPAPRRPQSSQQGGNGAFFFSFPGPAQKLCISLYVHPISQNSVSWPQLSSAGQGGVSSCEPVPSQNSEAWHCGRRAEELWAIGGQTWQIWPLTSAPASPLSPFLWLPAPLPSILAECPQLVPR